MQYWATESRATSHSFTNPDYETSSEYSDPSERRRYRPSAADACAVEDNPFDIAEDTMAVTESTKLKGVYWPGMDIFDSATPEMRRKRNQKKDSSVVEQLELNSQDVEPMELIFTPGGSFKRQRRISSSEWDDEDEMEIKSESPQPRKHRTALASLDGNTRRTRQLARQTFPLPSQSQYEERGRSIFEFGHNEPALKRKRGGFSVFQDDDTDEAWNQSSNFSYLTSGFNHHPSLSPISAFQPYRSPNLPFRYENKENVLPSFHQSYNNAHGFQGTAYHNPYGHGFGQDNLDVHYNPHLYHSSKMYSQDLDDDQRTITAPPSPCAS